MPNPHIRRRRRRPKAVWKVVLIDILTAALILGWVRKNLEGTDDPRRHGKALTGNLGGRWRYRVGDYRLLARIDDGRVLILVLHVGHRREIYE